MANYLVLRLVPKEPVDAGDFTGYLANLSFDVLDISFGSAAGGTSILTSGGFSEVVQHVQIALPPVLKSVATAVIEIELPSPEYRQPDILLAIQRSGTPIAHLALGYNVPVLTLDDPPETEDFRDIEASNVAAYVSLRSPALDGLAFVLPEDGSPPKYAELLAAVQDVLTADPGSTTDIAALTPAEARHIASEIVWYRAIEPLPAPPSIEALEAMYTGTGDDERTAFESMLTRYSAEHSARAEALAQYVYALSAALAAHETSVTAERAGLHVPTRPGEEPLLGKRGAVDVILVPVP